MLIILTKKIHQRLQPSRLAKTLAKDCICDLSSEKISHPLSPSNKINISNNMTTPTGPIFCKPSELTRLIRHDFSGNPNKLQAFLDNCNFANLYCPPKMVHNLFIEIVAHIIKAAHSN